MSQLTYFISRIQQAWTNTWNKSMKEYIQAAAYACHDPEDYPNWQKERASLLQHAGPGAAAALRVGRDGNQKRKYRYHVLVEGGAARSPNAR